MVEPRQPVPPLEVNLVGGERSSPADQQPDEIVGAVGWANEHDCPARGEA